MGRLRLLMGLLALFTGGLFGCTADAWAPTPTPPPPTPSPSLTSTPLPSATPTASSTPRVFPTPRETALTPVPPPADLLELPEGAHALLFLGLDRPDPYTGRSDAVILLLYHPRLAKAALVSLPPDLFVYLPGQTMQRLSSAYSLGGARLVADTLDYNLGLRPDDFVAANLDDFAILVDEAGGLLVPVLDVFPMACGDRIYPGEVTMDGSLALCYATLREGTDEAARGLRQQQLLRLLLDRFLQDGNLARLPELFALFRPRLDTSLTAADVAETIPLALRLADPERVAYFQVGSAQTTLWQISEQPPAVVFLPKPDQLRFLLEQAAAFLGRPAPNSELVLTLAAELTASPTVTLTGSPTPIPSWTEIPLYTASVTPTVSITPGPSPTGTITPTQTVTETFAP